MAQIRTRQLLGSDYKTPAPGLYGSLRASQFLKDARNGTDSVDIVTIADSNGLSPNTYGFQRGIHRVMSYQYGVDIYASSLMAGGYYLNTDLAPAGFSGFVDGAIMTGFTQVTNNDNVAGSTGTNSRLMTLYTADAQIQALVAHLGFDSTNYTDSYTTMLPKVNGWMWTPVVIPTGITFVGTGGTTNAVWLNTEAPIAYGATGLGGVSCQFRTVVGTFNVSGGQYKMSVYNKNSFSANAVSSFISTQTSGGGYGYKTTWLNFTTQSTATAGVYCSWDGAAQGAGNGCTGPFACLWMSAIQLNKKGYCVSNLMTMDGRTGTELAARVEGMDKNLDMYLKELRERQIEAGGTGRVVVFVNYGINADTSPTASLAYTNAADRIKTRIQARWVATGGSIANLAFIFAPSHPVTTSSGLPWKTNRAAVVTSASAWATANQNDNSGTCVVDGGIQYTSTKLNIGTGPSGSMYGSTGAEPQAHLNATTTSGSNGYDAFAGAIFSLLMSA